MNESEFPDFMATYALNGREVLKFASPIEFAHWMVEHGPMDYDPHVADEIVGDVRISTVLLPSAAYHRKGPPMIFETMAFDLHGDVIDVMGRYATYDEAEEGHKLIVSGIRSLHEASIETSQAMLSIIRGGLLISQRDKK